MTTQEIFRQLFSEFAENIRVTHEMISSSKSAAFKGAPDLSITYQGGWMNKMGVGIRLGPVITHEPQLFLIWIQEADDDGFEAIPSRKLEEHPAKPLVDAFLARAEELEKELTVQIK